MRARNTCISGRGRIDFATAQLVYDELRDGKYVMLWDSPLFNATRLLSLRTLAWNERHMMKVKRDYVLEH